MLTDVGKAITTLPETLKPHRTIAKNYEARREMVAGKQQIDWALAEQLAWGTLMKEGNHVRISGQDVERGTFSHRHCVVHDQMDGSKYVPLNALEHGQASLAASSLSGMASSGSSSATRSRTRRVSSCGRRSSATANTAQCMIDQFICGEQ